MILTLLLFAFATSQDITCLGISDCATCKGTSGCGYCAFPQSIGGGGFCDDSSGQTSCVSPSSWNPSSCPAPSALQICSAYTGNCSACQANSLCQTCKITDTVFGCYPKANPEYCPVAAAWGTSCAIDPNAVYCEGIAPAITSYPNGSVVVDECTPCEADSRCGYCRIAPNAGLCYSTDSTSCIGDFKPSSCDPNSCDTLSGLQFCTAFNGNTTDMGWVATAFDSYLASSWSDIKASVAALAKQYKFSVCDACWNALEQFTCAAVITPCGFTECYMNAATAMDACVTGTTCATACSGATDTSSVLNSACYQCYTNCANQALAACGQYMIGSTACQQLVQICGCLSDSDAAQVCSYFPSNGRTLNLGTTTCSNVPGWCGTTTAGAGNRLQDTSTPGQTCPNSHFCLTVPSSSGEAKVSSPIVAQSSTTTSGASIFAADMVIVSLVVAFLALV